MTPCSKCGGNLGTHPNVQIFILNPLVEYYPNSFVIVSTKMWINLSVCIFTSQIGLDHRVKINPGPSPTNLTQKSQPNTWTWVRSCSQVFQLSNPTWPWIRSLNQVFRTHSPLHDQEFAHWIKSFEPAQPYLTMNSFIDQVFQLEKPPTRPRIRS